jgi:hypothetical protein
MIEAVYLSHEKKVSGEWSNNQVSAYCMSHGISHDAIARIIEHADRAMNWAYLSGQTERDSEEYQWVARDREKNPGNYSCWPPPTLWIRGTSLQQTIDAIMHLLFLGVKKKVVSKTRDWMTSCGKHAAFVRSVDGRLESIQRLNLSWCKAIGYRAGKLGGWISESYLAMARLQKWFYAGMDQHDVVTEDPDLTIENKRTWTVKKCKLWLELRELPRDGKAAILKQRVEGYLRQNGGPPTISLVRPTLEEVQMVQRSLTAVIAKTMAKTVAPQDIEEVRRLIKNFLSLYVRMTTKLERGKEKHGWIDAYNFPSLLNIPEYMEMYGPLRSLWEGGYQGEGILVYVKQ